MFSMEIADVTVAASEVFSIRPARGVVGPFDKVLGVLFLAAAYNSRVQNPLKVPLVVDPVVFVVCNRYGVWVGRGLARKGVVGIKPKSRDVEHVMYSPVVW
jgi:hypothetical protein